MPEIAEPINAYLKDINYFRTTYPNEYSKINRTLPNVFIIDYMTQIYHKKRKDEDMNLYKLTFPIGNPCSNMEAIGPEIGFGFNIN